MYVLIMYLSMCINRVRDKKVTIYEVSALCFLRAEYNLYLPGCILLSGLSDLIYIFSVAFFSHVLL